MTEVMKFLVWYTNLGGIIPNDIETIIQKFKNY